MDHLTGFGSYAKRNRPKISIRKFAKVTLLITLALAAIEVLVIYLFMNTNRPSLSETPPNSRLHSVSKRAVPNAPTMVASLGLQVTEDTSYRPRDTVTTAEKVQAIAPGAAAIGAKTDTLSAIGDSLVKPAVVTMTRQRMASILGRIQKIKAKKGLAINCVQVRQTSNSNVANAFRLAGYLKDNGFVIGGRLTVSGSVNGVQVTTKGDCIQLTIGVL